MKNKHELNLLAYTDIPTGNLIKVSFARNRLYPFGSMSRF
jgi:hypothetical protein